MVGKGEKWRRWIRGLLGEHGGANKERKGRKGEGLEMTVSHLCSSLFIHSVLANFLLKTYLVSCSFVFLS